LPTTSAGWRRWNGWLPHRGVVCRARPKRAPSALNTAYSRQIMSQNHGRDAPAINSTKNLSLFEVPYRYCAPRSLAHISV
jgi:hypothetical protein